MLVEVKRFHRAARRLLDGVDTIAAHDDTSLTLGDFLAAGGYSRYFRQHFMVPLVSCVWSCAPRAALLYPAHSLFTFLDHHGALSVSGSPEWRTVVGGSRSYVERAAKELTATELSTPVRAVTRTARGIAIHDDADDVRAFDAAVVATHADDALALLAEPTSAERATLGAFTSSVNETVLHTDGSVLPTHRQARASWNYLLDHCASSADEVHVSYDMNRLHRLDEPRPHVVTLNPGHRVADGLVLARMRYTHPVYTSASVAAQSSLPGLSGGRLAFAGAYHGWGFHEDGCLSGVRAAVRARGGVVRPRLYRTRVTHGRTERVRHGFSYGHPTWLVDLDVPPTMPRGLRGLARFDARDHLGDPAASIRANVDAYLATEGVHLDGGSVLMLATPRSFGYAFNPLTVFWCHDRDRDAGLRRRGGAQHLRRAALLPPPTRRRRERVGREGVLRVAVLRRRRRLRDDLHRPDRHRRAPGRHHAEPRRPGRVPRRPRGPSRPHVAVVPGRRAAPSAHRVAGGRPDPLAGGASLVEASPRGAAPAAPRQEGVTP